MGTFAGMEALGFSINTLTLFGMVLAIGIVVDDAIVVVENVERHMEAGEAPKEAAINAMTEVSGPIIAIVLVLCAVFVPVGFLGGITGQLYKQFAITIATAVTISGFVALTLSPALCALVLRPRQEVRKGVGGLFDRGFAIFNSGFDWMRAKYVVVAETIVRRSVLAVAVFGVILLLSALLLRILPASFLPDEDQGYFLTMVQLPDGASLQRTDAVLSKLEQYFLANPIIHSTDALAGQNFVFSTRGSNSATMFTPLVDWDQRKRPDQHAKALIGDAYQRIRENPRGDDSRLQCALHQRSGGDRRVFCPGAGSDRRRFSKIFCNHAGVSCQGQARPGDWCGGYQLSRHFTEIICQRGSGKSQGPGDSHLRYF